MSKKSHVGAFGLGFFFREWRVVLVGLVFLYFVGLSAWSLVPGFLQWLIVVGLLVVAAWWARARFDPRRGQRKHTRGRERYRPAVDFVPKGKDGLNWVYVITEWRGRDDCWLDRDRRDRSGRFHPDAVKHLVYVGLTNSLTHRFLQHSEDKHWWHGELMFEVAQFPTRLAAARLEQKWIAQASAKRALADRPRENYEHNPTYDRKRCEHMHRRRLDTMPQELAA